MHTRSCETSTVMTLWVVFVNRMTLLVWLNVYITAYCYLQNCELPNYDFLGSIPCSLSLLINKISSLYFSSGVICFSLLFLVDGTCSMFSFSYVFLYLHYKAVTFGLRQYFFSFVLVDRPCSSVLFTAKTSAS